MRVLLIQPDYPRVAEDGHDLAARLLPARSLLELEALLVAAGHEVMVLDPLTALAITGERQRLDLPAALAALLDEQKFDLVGIAVYTALRQEAHQLAAIVKRHSRKTKVVVGGPHPGLVAKSLLSAWTEVDYVCLGASENSLPGIVSSLAGETGPVFKVKHIAFRTSMKAIRLTGKADYHADLAGLPPVRYDRYLTTVPDGRIRRAYLMTARGCDHWCNFCSSLWKKTLLADPAVVAAEIRHLVEDCGTEEVVLYDDCFGMRPDHARAVLEAVIATGVKVRLQTITRFDALREDWLTLFREAGGRDVLVGVETGSAKLRRKMNKHMPDEVICNGSELVRSLGFRMGVFLLFGFPNENEGDRDATYRLLKKMDPAQTMSSVFDIKPGDMLYEFSTASKIITPDAWLDESKRLINDMDEDELELAAARAMAFDRRFTREVIMPEHDSAGLILGLDPERAEQLIAKEMER